MRHSGCTCGKPFNIILEEREDLNDAGELTLRSNESIVHGLGFS